MAENKNENLNTILDATFKFAKKTAKEFYFKIWVKNSPKCPAFGGEVINISHYGWEHLIHDENKTKSDIMGRLFVLERVKFLLETATTFSEKRIIKNREYWVFDSVIEDVRLRVVVKSIDNQPKHFLTVIKKGTVETHLI